MTPARCFFALLPLLAACGGSDEPAWAIDPIWLEPTDTGVHGFQTWQLYTAKWEKKQAEKTFVCTVVVELEGVETPCTDCQIAWELTPALVDTDCPGAISSDPAFLSLERLSLGLPLDGDEDTPHPGLTSAGFADYGWGWEVHGQAWPDAADHGGGVSDPSWDGEVPFAFWPDLAWPLQP